MKYISTRGGGKPQNFEQVLLSGLAPDGGLYVPETWPQIDLDTLKGKSYIEIAEIVMYPFVEGSIERTDFKQIIIETYSAEIFRNKDVTPLHHLENYAGGNIHIMEQFHGPTIAFKDVALQLLGRLFDHVLAKRNERVTIVGATSGDTGSAAIEGCKTCDNIDIFILHPKGRVSEVQRKQMTTIDAPNVHNIAINGTFDDCQNMVKAMFNDAPFRQSINLSAVNSINWARIMAQIVYYFATATKLGAPNKDISFVVPTGNFGNVFAAYCAQNMGLPIKALGISTNKNDILTRFLDSGSMTLGDAHATLSPSMDIQISSNFERYLFDLLGRDALRLESLMSDFKDDGDISVSDTDLATARTQFSAVRTDDDETLALIKECYNASGYILDPHTAVGMKGAKEIASVDKDGIVVLLATAHPAKFPDAVERAINIRPELPAHLSDLMTRAEFMSEQDNDLRAVQDFVQKHTRVR
ncbi:MAG: threonine synthase [Zetaproteobacteria bacterium]|nr:MAG: threonine synthase [Zetaproteobacteria bacterium]